MTLFGEGSPSQTSNDTILTLLLSSPPPAHFLVWLASPEAAFLRGRLVWANWDVEELKSQAEEIQSGQKMTAGIVVWPYPHLG